MGLSLRLIYALCPVALACTYYYLTTQTDYSIVASILLSCMVGYLPAYLNTSYLSFGMPWKYFRHWPLWTRLFKYLDAKITVEAPLDPKQLYLFCNFPHGFMSANHGITMTDCCGMLSEIYPSPRLDLGASVLFLVPVLRELVMWLGCVDASSATAHRVLRADTSVLILIGGEKEQLLTKPNEYKIFLRTRKGFIKLALQYGAALVPMYAFGENELYECSDFAMGARKWLQHSLKVAVPIVFNTRTHIERPGSEGGREKDAARNYPWWCYLFGYTLLPNPHVPLQIEIGQPIPVEKVAKGDITPAMVDALHHQFCAEMRRLFDRTKTRHGIDQKAVLEIL